MLSNIFSVSLLLTAVLAAPQIVTGPGPVVTVSICHTIDSVQTCHTAPLSKGTCVDLATSAPEFDNSVDSISIGPLFASAPAVNCTLHGLANCGAAGHLNDRVVTVQSPGGDVVSDFTDEVSSYLCE
ncbi:hypothetical protein EDC01DRAFT_671895 [Geopyxis carbonaria]|nr:hypothetical protein EDC01DRAFT_671895 [Geopyxis carbonaria]